MLWFVGLELQSMLGQTMKPAKRMTLSPITWLDLSEKLDMHVEVVVRDGVLKGIYLPIEIAVSIVRLPEFREAE